MNIKRSVDIEDQIRLALKDYFTVYVRPLPASFTVPCVLIEQTGGTTENTIDRFSVKLSARATTDADAQELIRNVLGVLEEQTKSQVGDLRFITINSLASWGNDPVRPDLKLCTVTINVFAHKESFEIQEES